MTGDLFAADPDVNLAGRRVLLIDDLYTSGSTTASAAHALMEARADPPVVVTLGRHLSQDSQSRDFVERNGIDARTLDLSTCALHGRRPTTFPI